MDESLNKRLGKLLFELAGGRIIALGEIYNLVGKSLYLIACGYYSQRADVEDAIQGFLLELVTKSKKFNNNTNACAWIFKSFSNYIRNHLKRVKREVDYIAAQADTLRARSEAADEKFLENHLFVSEIFGKLTDEEQQLIVYKFWMKCSLSEIAEILKKPKSTIESRLDKLCAKIKKL